MHFYTHVYSNLFCKLLATSFIVAATQTAAQTVSSSIIITDTPILEDAPDWSVPGPRPTLGVYAKVDTDSLNALLAKAPMFRSGVSLETYALTIELPHPSGRMMPCFVAESSVMDQDLAAKFPNMQTYIVQSVDSFAAGRIELTHRGLTGMLREAADLSNAGGAWMIDRWQSGDDSAIISYWLRDLDVTADWSCQAIENPDVPQIIPNHKALDTMARVPGEMRTARLAVACTGEYGLHHCTIEGNPPNPNDPMAAIVTVVSRSNVVFETDLGVHFELVSNNDQIIYFDPQTDPYPDTCDGTDGSNCSSPVLSVNRTHVVDVIGSSNFDIGHCLTRISGGVAYLRSVCGSNKAGGISGIPRGGDIDPLSALVIIHEFGHQFGANHTFSGTRGRCNNNVRLASAWEAGSGSSPMAYAGGCPVGDEPPSDNIVQYADPWFHHGSILEMQSFLTGGGASCLVPTSNPSNIPVINSVTDDLAIPPGTPYILTAAATDSDGDQLTYSWEQIDSGEARPLTGTGSEDNGSGALFRIFPPVLSGSRTFPQWNDIISGTSTPGEQLPTSTGAVRSFRVIVRDNAPGSGNVAVSDYVQLDIASGASPFAVTSPIADQPLGAGSFDIAWDVGNTDSAPISCAEVHIRLSTDDGSSFAHDLGVHPNSGTASVIIPSDETSSARIIVESVDNIFFAVSESFSITGCLADTNGDGMLSPTDFSAWISAFNAQSPACDQNADSQCTSTDFTAWLANYNAGCD
jgi:hypothetical protein